MSSMTMTRPSVDPSTITTASSIFLDANVALTFGDYRSRAADYADPDTGALVWIGEDGAIVVDPDRVSGLIQLAAQAGWHARMGHVPADFGIDVRPFRPDFHHPAVGKVEAKYDRHSAWAIVRQALCVEVDA